MIKLHEKGELLEFADRDAIVAHFSLDALDADTLSCVTASSDAGWPLHAAIDPCVLELREKRVLLVEASACELRAEYRMRCGDI